MFICPAQYIIPPIDHHVDCEALLSGNWHYIRTLQSKLIANALSNQFLAILSMSHVNTLTSSNLRLLNPLFVTVCPLP